MGRKNRNNISDKTEDDFNADSDIEETDEDLVDREFDKTLKIMELRSRLIRYTQDHNIPLCEYLTVDLMTEFVDWIRK